MMKRFFVMVRKNTMLVIAFAMISAMTLTAVANIDNGKAVTSPRLFYNGQELTDGAMIPRGGIITAEYDFVLSGKDREITVVLPDNLVPARDNGLLYLYNNNDELLGQLPLDDIIDSTITVKLTDIQLEALYTKSSRVTSDNYIISTLRGLILQVYAADNVYELNDADDMNESVSGNDINDVGDTDTVDTTDQADTPNPAEDAGQTEEPATTEASDQSETFVSYEGKLIIECIPDPEIEEDYIVIGDMTITLFDMSMLTREFILDTNNLDSMEKVVEDFLVSLLYLNYEKVESEAAISFADYLRLYYDFNLTPENIETILDNESPYYIVPVPKYLTVLEDVNSLPAELIVEGIGDIFAVVDVAVINEKSYLIICFDKIILSYYKTTGLEGGFIDVVCALDKAEIDDNTSVPIILSESSELEIIISEDSVYVPEIKKTGDYDPATGMITWTIEYTHGSVLDNDGKTTRIPVYITDTFTSADQVFVDESLDVNGQTAKQVVLADIKDLVAGEYTCININNDASQQLVYMLPSDLVLGEMLTITYHTALTEETLDNIMHYDGSTAKKITNNAQVTDDLTREAIDSDKAEVEVTGNDKLWIHKIGSYVESDDRSGGYIKWTIYVNVFDDTMTYLDLYDLIADGLIFDKNSVEIVKIINEEKMKCDDFELEIKGTDDTIDTDDNNSEYSFIIHFPAPLSIGTYQITYTTDVARVNYETGEDQSLENTAWLDFGWPEGEGPIPGLITRTPPTVAKPVDIASNSLEKRGDSYDNVTHTITWEVTINPHQVYISEGTFTDNLKVFGQQYDAGSFELADKDKDKWSEIVTFDTYEPESGILTINVGEIETNSVTFTFDAIVTDLTMWSDNQDEEYFKNTAYLTAFIIPDSGEIADGGYVTISADGTVLVNIDVLEKDSDGYDYINQTITWQVIVNADKIPMTDAMIVDTLPKGLIVDLNEVKVVNFSSPNVPILPTEYEVSWVRNYENGKETDSTLTIDLKDIADEETLVITYKTLVNPDSVDGFWNESSVELKNSVTLQREGKFISKPVVESVCIDGPVVSKSGKLVTEDGKIEYTIELNPNKLNMATGEEMNRAVITDYLPDGMLLDLSSVKLYLADIDADGKLSIPTTKPTVPLILGENLIYGYNNDPDIGPLGQYFKIILNGTLQSSGESLTKQRYILQYTAYLFTNATKSYKNEVTIDGHSELPAEAKSNIMVYKASGGIRAITFNTTARVQITKIDEAREEIKLEGVTFELYEVKDGNENLLYTDKTDSNGVVLFGGLVNGHKYRIYETASIAGYPMSNNSDYANEKRLVREIEAGTNNIGQLIPFEFANEPNRNRFSFIKMLVETNGTAKTANKDVTTFVATDQTEHSVYSVEMSSDDNGVVTFKNLPFGIYKITEKVTPTYYKAADPFYACIDINGDFKGFSQYKDGPFSYDTTNTDKVNNIRKTFNLTLSKRDSIRSGVYINDVVFYVYKSLNAITENELNNLLLNTPAANFIIQKTEGYGTATFTKLEQGYYYYIFEQAAPNGYNNVTGNTVGQLVATVTPEETTTISSIEIKNPPKLGDFSFKKYGSDALNPLYPLAGVEFTATDQTARVSGSTAYSEKAYSIADGTVTFKDLPFGIYLVTESRPLYYNAAASFYAVISTDGKPLGFFPNTTAGKSEAEAALKSSSPNANASNYYVTNIRRKFNLTFTKIDNRAGRVFAVGAEFALYRSSNLYTQPSKTPGSDGNYKYVGTATSNEAGEIKFTYKANDSDSDLKYLEQGYYYYLYEITVPAGYKNPPGHVATINASSTNIASNATYTYAKDIVNEAKLGEIVFLKYGTKYNEDTPLKGAVFKAYDLTNGSKVVAEATSGDDGKVVFSGLPFGVYRIEETKTPDYYQTPTEVFYAKIDVDGNLVGFSANEGGLFEDPESYIVKNKRKTFSIDITKRDSIRAYHLIEGVTFELYRSLTKTEAPDHSSNIEGCELVKKTKTLEDGTAEFSDLDQGYYYFLYEVSAPEGYNHPAEKDLPRCILTIYPRTDRVSGYKYSTNIYNEPNTGGFRFTKTDQSGALQDAEFTATRIKDIDAPEEYVPIESTVKSNEYGIVEFAGLPFGIYMITEEKMNYYEKLEPFYVKIDNNGNFEGYSDSKSGPFEVHNDHEVSNIRKTFSLKLYKTDRSTNKPIENVEFKLYRAEIGDTSNQTWVETMKTDSDGNASFNDDNLFRGYDYIIYETDTPPGYKNNITDKPIEIFTTDEETDYYEFSYQNDPEIGGFSFTKVDEFGVLADITFTVTDLTKGRAVSPVEATSAGNGLVTFNDLPFGIYMITEEDMDYYEKLSFYAKINEDGTFGGFWDSADLKKPLYTNGEVNNVHKKFSLTLTKIDSSTNNTIEGVKFEIYRAEYGITEKSSQEYVTEEFTKASGVAEFDFSKLYQGYWYFIYETGTPAGFTENISDSTPIAIFFADNGNKEYDFVLTEGNGGRDGNTIYNKPNVYSLSFTKVDEFEAMEGVIFTATDKTVGRIEKFTQEVTSDENGRVVFTNLPYGLYEVEEKSHIPFYVTRDKFYVEIDGDGSVVDIYTLIVNEDGKEDKAKAVYIDLDNDGGKFMNLHEPHVLSIVKQDSRKGSVLVEGIEFEVYYRPADEHSINRILNPPDNPEGSNELKLLNKSEYTVTNVTNETGRVTFSGLKGGFWYYVYEIPTRGYSDSDDYKIKFVASGFAEENESIALASGYDYEYIKLEDKNSNYISYNSYTNFVKNDPNIGRFSFTKVDEYGTPMADVEFTATDMTLGSEVKQSIRSDADGKVEFTQLPFGVYKITETPVAYYKQIEFFVKINENGTFGGFYSTEKDAVDGIANKRWITPDGGRIYNERKTVKLSITKTDNVRLVTIPGVTFELFEGGISTPVETKVTNADGKLIFEALKQGVTYEIVEITPEGYKPLTDPIVYRITPDDKEDGYAGYAFTVENEPVVTIKFRTVTESGSPLPGVEFRMRKLTSDGEEAEEWIAISDEDGIVTFDNVVSGRYRIWNISVPDRYDIKETVYYAEVRWDPVLMSMFAGLMYEDGTLVEGNELVYGYTEPGSNSGTNSKQDPVTGLSNPLPQTGQNKILAATLCICGIVLTTIGAYGFRKRRNQKNEK